MNAVKNWIKERIWVTPALYSLGAIVLSVIVYYIDLLLIQDLTDYIPAVLLTKVSLAQNILSVLAAAILTMATFMFSTALVVLTTYSSQFSPRTLENFIYSIVTRRVLGIFIGGFIYETLALLYMQNDRFTHEVIAAFIGILVSFFCVGAFAYYVNYVASNIQVDTLINGLTDDAESVIAKYKTLYEEDYVQLREWKPAGIRETIYAKEQGYVQSINLKKLSGYAKENDIQIEVIMTIGDFVHEGKLIAYVYKKADTEVALDSFYFIGSDRTAEQDLEYTIQKPVEVALRAISPGTNDPNTANDIILRVGRLLGKMGQLKTDDWVLTDKDDKDWVLYRFPSYSNIVYNAFYQLAHYGKEDISVLISISEALIIAADIAPERRYKALWETQKYILEGLRGQRLKTLDREHLQKRVDTLAEITGNSSVSIKMDYEEA